MSTGGQPGLWSSSQTNKSPKEAKNQDNGGHCMKQDTFHWNSFLDHPTIIF